MNITELISSIHEINEAGNVKISSKLDGFDSDTVLWERNSVHLKNSLPLRFSDDVWFGKEAKSNSINFSGLSYRHKTELKALVLVYHKLGFILGDYGFKWETCCSISYVLFRLSKIIETSGVSSLFQLDKLKDMQIIEVFERYREKHGINTRSNAKTILDALTVSTKLGLTGARVLELCQRYISECRTLQCHYPSSKSFSVIPIPILKRLIKQITEEIKQVSNSIVEWERTNDSFCEILKNSSTKYRVVKPADRPSDVTRRYFRHNALGEPGNVYRELNRLYPTFRKLRLNVYVLALIYTGMRSQEALYLLNGAGRRKESSERFYVESRLSKTAAGLPVLNWVTNKDTVDAIDLLSRFNRCFIHRAEVLLSHHSHDLSEESLHNLRIGSSAELLFGVIPSACSVRFSDARLGGGGNVQGKEGVFTLSAFKLKLCDRSVEQLEALNCNYKKVRGVNGGVPYESGELFKLSSHQFRHTFAWFIVANRLGDVDDVKYQFKHLNDVMPMVYSNRGYDTIENLLNLVSEMDYVLVSNVLDSIVDSAMEGHISGGGGKRIKEEIDTLMIQNGKGVREKSSVASRTKVSHFKSVEQFRLFLKNNHKDIRGLPHGYCMAGTRCKVKNAAIPHGCVACGNYIVEAKHLPHWIAMKTDAEQKLASYEQLDEENKRAYKLMAEHWIKTVEGASLIISEVQGRDTSIVRSDYS